MTDPLRLGAWVRAGDRVGLVARVDEQEVTLFFPGERQMAVAPLGEVQPVPAGAVRVTASVDLPLAHGMGEDLLRRWVAALLDETLRGRAFTALRDASIDEGAALPGVTVSVEAAPEPGALCLCGAVTPTDPGRAVPCASCGRQAVTPPVSAGGPAVRAGRDDSDADAGSPSRGPLDDFLDGHGRAGDV